MANAVQQALDRASKSQGFKEAQEVLKTNNLSLAVDNTDRTATQNNPSKANSVEAALNRTNNGAKLVPVSYTVCNRCNGGSVFHSRSMSTAASILSATAGDAFSLTGQPKSYLTN